MNRFVGIEGEVGGTLGIAVDALTPLIVAARKNQAQYAKAQGMK